MPRVHLTDVRCPPPAQARQCNRRVCIEVPLWFSWLLRMRESMMRAGSIVELANLRRLRAATYASAVRRVESIASIGHLGVSARNKEGEPEDLEAGYEATLGRGASPPDLSSWSSTERATMLLPDHQKPNKSKQIFVTYVTEEAGREARPPRVHGPHVPPAATLTTPPRPPPPSPPSPRRWTC